MRSSPGQWIPTSGSSSPGAHVEKSPTYEAAVPARIADRALTSSVRNVALAELSDDAPANARIVQGSLAAMRAALSLKGDLSTKQVLAVHHALIEPTGATLGGTLRGEQVWIGGTSYSPHGALFVPPRAGRVRDCLDDLLAFAARDDLNPVVKAAVAHAQLETIHPFVDGNGRTGRALLHLLLKQEGVISRGALPVSAGLLHNVDRYMESISSYQAGDVVPVVSAVVDALELALVVGGRVADLLDEVMEGWARTMTERRESAIHRLPSLLASSPWSPSPTWQSGWA